MVGIDRQDFLYSPHVCTKTEVHMADIGANLRKVYKRKKLEYMKQPQSRFLNNHCQTIQDLSSTDKDVDSLTKETSFAHLTDKASQCSKQSGHSRYV